MLDIAKVNITYISLDKINIDIMLKHTLEDIALYSISLLRNQNIIMETGISDIHMIYIDNVIYKANNSEFSYNIEIRKDNELKKFGPFHSHDTHNKLAYSIRHKFNIATKRFGTPIIIFRKIMQGPRCECYDEILQKSTRSNCSICRGTGFISGYHTGQKTLAMFQKQDANKLNLTGKESISQIGLRINNYISVSSEDIISVPSTGMLYNVTSCKKSMLKDTITSQEITAVSVSPDSIKNELMAQYV